MPQPWLALFTLTLAACSTQSGESCHVAHVVDFPFHVADHHILVDAKINGAPASLVFDTGSFTTTITAEAAKRLHLRTQIGYIGQAQGIGGARDLSLVQAKTIELGTLHARNFDFVASAAGMALPGHADGLLSTDMLSLYDVDLDLGDRRINLYYPTSDCSRPAAVLTAPLYSVDLLPMGADHTPRVLVTIGDKQFVGLIDSGASRTVMFRNAASRLGLHVGDLTNDPHGLSSGIGPNDVAGVRHIFEPITIGALTVNNMPVVILDQRSPTAVDMLLGLDFQSRVHVWISYSSETLIMQFPPKLSPRIASRPQG